MSHASIAISSLVHFRQESGLTQKDVAAAMSITQSAVARLEKRLMREEDITVTSLERYAEAVGVQMNISFEHKHRKSGLFATAEDAIKFAVHSSACEGMTTPPEDIENLRRLARGEISADALIQQYIAEAIEEDRKAHVG